jgi:lipopolysaccharide export system permease protein
MLFDSTLRRDLARSFGATLVVVLTIVVTMMLMRTLAQAAGGKVSPQDVLLLLGFAALGYLPTILTLSLFVATVATLTRMYRDSEMTIWFASGVSLSRFVRPLMRTSWPVLLVVLVMALFVWPWVNQRGVVLKDRYERRSDLSRIAAGQFQSSGDGRRVFFIDRESQDDATVGRNVFVLTRQGDTEAVTSARAGRIEFDAGERFVLLERGQRNEENFKSGEKTLARFESYRALVSEKAVANLDNLPPTARGTFELLLQPTPAFQGEFAWRIGIVLGSANLLLMAIGLAATNPRRPGSWNLVLALTAFAVYFNLINLSQAWIANGKVSLGVMLLALHGGAFALALAALWWRDHASTLRLLARPRRRAAA